MAVAAVAQNKVSVALACRAFGVSERCYSYERRLKPENERISDLLMGLTRRIEPGALACAFCTFAT
jgi:putative transposase